MAHLTWLISHAGLGFALWFGLGEPNGRHGVFYLILAILFATLLAHPLYLLIRRGRQAPKALLQQMGRMAAAASIALLALLPIFILSMDGMSRARPLGATIAALALATLFLSGWHQPPQTSPLQRAHLAARYAGFGMIIGAMMAGLMQISIVLTFGLLVLLVLKRFSDGRWPGFWSLLFSCALPLLMMTQLRIDHMLAAPLIASTFAGFWLSVPRAGSRSRM